VDFTNTGTVQVASGTLSLTGAFSNFASSTLTGGTYSLIAATFQFPGAAIVTNAATIVLDGASSRIIDQSGNDALAGFASSLGSFTIQNGRNLTTASDLSNAVSLTVGANSTLMVSGAYTQNGGNTLTSAGATFAASGLVNLLGGTLSGGGTVSGNVSNAATLSGTLTINGNVTNSGQINPGGSGTAGVLTINGNYTQTASGVLNIDIGGTGSGNYDQLVVSGSGNLDGTLTVFMINGYNPLSGDTFQIVTSGMPLTGTFATVNVGPFQPPIYDPMDVTLMA
jgi:hypothetical protein